MLQSIEFSVYDYFSRTILDQNQTYSYADYLTWQFDQFVELIKGKIMPMAAPNRYHQKVSIRIAAIIENFLEQEGKRCELYEAPFDVRLVKNPEGKTNKEIYTVVQPDICVICDPSKLDEQGCLGAPDLIIEIVSVGNSKRDIQDKFELYQENGVKEYWLVRPYENSIEQFWLENERYQLKGIYTQENTIRPIIIPDLGIDLQRVFKELKP